MNHETMKRRRFLKHSATLGAALLLPAAFSRAQVTPPGRLPPTEPVLEGPFYPLDWPRLPSDLSVDDNADLVWVNGKLRYGMGTILELSGRVLDVNGRPLRNIEVHLWQCDTYGRYHHPGDTHTRAIDNNFQGRGRAVTDGDGRYSFRTIKPVPYPGRTPHLHLKLKSAGAPDLLTTQMFVDGDARNQQDGIFLAVPDNLRNTVTAKLSPPEAIRLGGVARQRVRGEFDMVLGATPRIA